MVTSQAMTTTTPEDGLSPENSSAVQTIVLMRIYDVLTALLRESNKDVARDLMEMHAAGIIFGPVPTLSGDFLYNELNSTGVDNE